MKVGIYSQSYPKFGIDGGIGSYTQTLARGMAHCGHEVHVVTSKGNAHEGGDGPVAVHASRDDYLPLIEKVLPGSGACFHLGTTMKRLARIYDLDIVEFPNWEGLGLWYGLGRPTPLVVRLHTSSAMSTAIDGNVRPRLEAWDRRRERWLSMIADRLVTHSLAHRDMMARELDLDPCRIAVLPHGIETFPDFRRPEPCLGHPTVVFLGRMERRKGTIDLILAVPEVVREIPNARFILIGIDRPHCPGGRTHARFVDEELPAEVRSRIEFAGRLPQDEVDAVLQRADLFVAPSLYESFGLIFLEAMRWGTPVIGTTAGGIPEIVQDGRSGRLVPPGDHQALAATIIGLLRDEPGRRRLGEAGRRRVESSFTVDAMARRTADLYSRVIEERS